jgi:hypothetical protein
MLIDTSSYCKRCGKIALVGDVGSLWNETHELYEVNMCADCVIKLLDGKSASGTILNRSSMCEKALKAGTPILDDSSWRPTEDK